VRAIDFTCDRSGHTIKPSSPAEQRKAQVTKSDLFEDQSNHRVSVLLPLPLTGAYDYSCPAELNLAPGDIVEVPLGRRTLHGVVWGNAQGEVDAKRLKTVLRRYPVAPLPATVRRLVEWVAAYTLAPPGAVLRMALSVPAAFEAPPAVILFAALPPSQPPPDIRLTPGRRRVLAVLQDGPPRPLRDLAFEAGVGVSVVKSLHSAGALTLIEEAPPSPFKTPDWTRPAATLSAQQADAAEQLVAAVKAQSFSVTLLDGVTGAGKTEVYFEAIAAAFAAGQQVLVLLPEIALTPHWLTRFEDRFGCQPAAWHSELKPPMRRRTWRAVAEGQAAIVVGARSALFLPFHNLGLIIVDEEHESAFKQGDGVHYHGRDMAVVRAQLGQHASILVSATPSLETFENVRNARYQLAHLPARHGVAELPKVELIDLRQQPPPRGRWLAPPLADALRETLERGEQAMLFLNRRGYAPLTLCRSCGHRYECPSCSAWMVEHRLSGRLQCHHCGYTEPRPLSCAACGAEDSLVASGPGVERLAEALLADHPDVRFMIASSDTVAGPAAAAEFIRSVTSGEVDVVIGTQMVAKGHHFPLLTLVGVVDADLGLAGGDLRAGERTYQLLHQVAGRAGRGLKPGRVFLQTHQPESPVMQALAAGDRDQFLEIERRQRQAAAMPPFGRLAALVVSAADGAAADQLALMIARAAPQLAGVDVLGPAPAPLALLRGRHRRRLLVKARREINLQKVLSDWLSPLKIPNNARLAVDIDPYNFL
jgi:primosomal protein N' (replication factor Y)